MQKFLPATLSSLRSTSLEGFVVHGNEGTSGLMCRGTWGPGKIGGATYPLP